MIIAMAKIKSKCPADEWC